MSGETLSAIPPVPPPPESPKRKTRTALIAAILVIMIVVAVGASVYVLSLNQQKPNPTPQTTPSEHETYSKYGFSFDFPKGMSMSEQGMLESTATQSSGMVLGLLENGEIEIALIGWINTVAEPDLDGALEGALGGIKTEGVTDVKVGQLLTTAKAGDTVKYQYFNMTVEDTTIFGFAVTHKNFYGIWGVWYNDATDRFYQLGFLYSEQNVLPKFQQYLDSFTG